MLMVEKIVVFKLDTWEKKNLKSFEIYHLYSNVYYKLKMATLITNMNEESNMEDKMLKYDKISPKVEKYKNQNVISLKVFVH